MLNRQDIFKADNEKLPELSRTVLIEQIKWLISLRWFAVAGIVISSLICTYVFPVLPAVNTIHTCALVLLIFNVLYLIASFKCDTEPTKYDITLAMVQIEVDIIILTVLLHFSGGITNPFIFFYLFHVILAAIILPKVLSFAVGMSSIAMFGIMAVGEYSGWRWFEHHPLNFSTTNSLWKNPVYMLGVFVAFSATVVLAQYLTRAVVVRMTSKEIEAARHKDLLEAIIKAMGEGLLFLNNEGNVAISNPQAAKWAGGDEITLERLPEKLVEYIKSLKTAVEDDCRGVNFKVEENYIEAKGCPVLDAENSKLGFVVVGQDLTEHKKLESELRARTEETAMINEMLKMSRVELAHREKMVAIGQMASGIAHEIGNPLASLSSIVQYIGRKVKEPEQSEQLGLMKTQIDRISNIIRRMLSLSRPATSEYKWVDVNTVIDTTLSLVKFDKRAKNVRIENAANNDLPMVWLNPLHYEQVLLNITINALDAMGAKNDDTENVLNITRHFVDDMVEVRVSDTGVGMKQDICRRAFESFFTTKEIGKGTGLGLYISYNLITEVDGSIELDSEPGKGTTVIIKVPVRPKKDLVGDVEINQKSKIKMQKYKSKVKDFPQCDLGI